MSSDNTPNFDNMTPEEIMAWMESLAKRQGADEGFTTAADVDVPEIDPNSVVIDEPGYIPYGQEEQYARSAAKPAAAAPPPPPQPQPAPVPLPLDEAPAAPPPAEPVAEPPAAKLESSMGESALAWLESLAADQSASDFNLDLASLEPETAPVSEAKDIDPMTWLQGIASEPELPETKHPEFKSADEPLGGIDPMEWLESLARRQGVPSEDLTTAASLDVPIPDEADVNMSPADADQPEPARENPAAWLDSLAVAGGFEDEAVRAEPSVRARTEDEMSIEAIEQAIREGVVTPEQIRFYQEYQMERAAQRDDVEDYDVDVDIPAEAAEMPDWLAEMKAEAEAETQEETAPAERPPLEALFEAPASPASAVAFPDWLSEDEGESETIESIFADEDASDIKVDYTDPWVEAFDEEYERGGKDIETVPDWYLKNTSDPERMAIVDEVISSATVPSVETPVENPPQPEPVAAPIQVVVPVQLAHAELPNEANLPAGERQALPAWISISSTQTAAAVSVPPPTAEAAPTAVPPSGTPDWLQEIEEPPGEEVPDWLSEIAPVEDVPPAPAPAAVTVSPPPAAPPVVSGTLDQARTRYRDGDMEGSLAIYEGLVRTSQVLADVANDLANMAKEQKNNPVVYRVLGDSLMRQGRLQEALNTYREALNWL